MKVSSARLAKVGMGLRSAKRAILKLEDELQNMSAGQKEEFGDSVFQALSVKSAKASSSPVFQAEVFNSRTSTKGKTEELCADTGCSKPIIGAAICKEQKIPIKPLNNNMTITDASGRALNIVGTSTFFVKSQVFGGKMKMVKAAVLEGNDVDREILISLELLQSWDLVTSTFPHETISDYIIRKNKESNHKHLFYSAKTSKVIYEREGLHHKVRDPSTSCLKLKEKIVKKFKNSFATSLGPNDRMSIPPVKLEIDQEKLVPPVNHTRYRGGSA